MIGNYFKEGEEIWEMVTSFSRGVNLLRMVKDMGEGGVKKQGKSGDVLYGRPLVWKSFCTLLICKPLYLEKHFALININKRLWLEPSCQPASAGARCASDKISQKQSLVGIETEWKGFCVLYFLWNNSLEFSFHERNWHKNVKSQKLSKLQNFNYWMIKLTKTPILSNF